MVTTLNSSDQSSVSPGAQSFPAAYTQRYMASTGGPNLLLRCRAGAQGLAHKLIEHGLAGVFRSLHAGNAVFLGIVQSGEFGDGRQAIESRGFENLEGLAICSHHLRAALACFRIGQEGLHAFVQGFAEVAVVFADHAEELGIESVLVYMHKQRGHKTPTFALRQLLRLVREYPREPLLAAVREAARYGLYDLDRLERMILRRVPRAIALSGAMPANFRLAGRTRRTRSISRSIGTATAPRRRLLSPSIPWLCLLHLEGHAGQRQS